MDLEKHFDWVADHDARARKNQHAFHAEIRKLIQFHVEPGRNVLEWGCGAGALLASLKPSRGLGLDISEKMLEKARSRHPHPHLEFRKGDLHDTLIDEPFDAIILDYLSGYLTDIQTCLENLRSSAHARTRLYLTSLNSIWRPVLAAAQPLGLVTRQPPSNWLSTTDLLNLLELAGWEVVVKSTEVLFPFGIPGLRGCFNRVLARLPFFQHFGSTLFLVARPVAKPALNGDISCSVVVPARNESGNIRAALERIPVLGKGTEVIFVEGNSIDDTWEVIQRECRAYAGPHTVRFCRQPGKGKWDAVAAGFERARGDVLVIQDGDLTAPPCSAINFSPLPSPASSASPSRTAFAGPRCSCAPTTSGCCNASNPLEILTPLGISTSSSAPPFSTSKFAMSPSAIGTAPMARPISHDLNMDGFF